jgi:acetyltransferase-like isoleucine patch superfamily enzyme
MALKDRLKSNPTMKRLAMWMATSENGIRPRWWVRKFVNPFYHKRGKDTIIFSRARLDLMPFNHFSIGNGSTIEDFAIVNNGLGPVNIGNFVFLGASNVVIGPVTIHDHVMTGQHVVMSGLNHGFDKVTIGFRYQPCTTAEISIGEGSWIGANVVITSGVQVGKFCVIAAGSVVTKNVPEYSMVAGNPARLLKQYNHDKKEWERVGRAE